ncbi:MAG: hypothetical protein PHV43_02465 [Candidatus Colwellbacteria bacterium]|nr:hypothetical protein [Candidatus Colwellbacteria bacterium]
MENKKTLYIVVAILILAVIGMGLFLVLNNRGAQEEVETGSPTDTSPTTADDGSSNKEEMVDCGISDNPSCFINRMNACLPVTVRMVGSDGSTNIKLTILGIEDNKCHFQREINGVKDLDCLFPKGTLNTNTLDQMFGNERGLQSVVDAACTSGW